MALLGHESEEHYHSLDNVGTLSTEKGEDVAESADYMKEKYGEEKTSEEYLPKVRSEVQLPFSGNF